MATRRSFKTGLGPLRTADAGVRSEWARHTLQATIGLMVICIFLSYSSLHVTGPKPQAGHPRYISFPRTTARQIHTSETWGIHQASLSGAYYGTPVVINIWLRSLCAVNQSVVRGFASADFVGSPTATYDGVKLLPDAITSHLPSLRVYLTDSTEQQVEQLYSNTQFQHLRSTFHFQAALPSNVTIAAIGIPEWDVRAHISSPVPCSISASPMPNPTWAQAGSSWSVVYLPMAPMNSFDHPNNSADTMQQPVATESAPLGCSKRHAEPLSERVLRTLSGNQRAGVSELILISPDSITLQQLLQHSAIQGAVDSGELVLWLWVSTHITIYLLIAHINLMFAHSFFTLLLFYSLGKDGLLRHTSMCWAACGQQWLFFPSLQRETSLRWSGVFTG